MGRAYNTKREKTAFRNLVKEPKGKRSPGRPRHWGWIMREREYVLLTGLIWLRRRTSADTGYL
jgi:hypothetical protein